MIEPLQANDPNRELPGAIFSSKNACARTRSTLLPPTRKTPPYAPPYPHPLPDSELSNDAIELVSEKLGAGDTLKAVAEAIGVSITSTWRIAEKLGIPRRRKPRICDSVIHRARQLFEDGYSLNRIARECGISKDSAMRLNNDRRSPRSQRKTRCPHCGALISIVPCVMCTTLGNA